MSEGYCEILRKKDIESSDQLPILFNSQNLYFDHFVSIIPIFSRHLICARLMVEAFEHFGIQRAFSLEGETGLQ